MKHGSKSWPTRVVNNVMSFGWSEFCAAHNLKNGYKVILCCEQRWIFDTIILNQNDVELRYDWSQGLNPYWQELYDREGIT